MEQIRQYAGPEGSPTVQTTTMSYDGYGRLETKHVPEQNAGTFTPWDYNSDDTIQKITDARGSISNWGKRNNIALAALPAGNRSIIYLYDPFFEESVGGTTTQFGREISPDQARAITILHEFAHAVWRTFHAGPFGMTPEELDRAIFEKCFDGGKQPLPRGVAE